MTAFMLACYMNGVVHGSIYFRSVKDCMFYSEHLSGQTYDTDEGSEVYNCMCKLVPQVNDNKVKVY